MALPVPNLDDRRFQDLVDDAKRLVAAAVPGVDRPQRVGPGVTLIELFAWMTDQLLYRLNRVPDRLYVKFLELIGVRLFPPTAARGEVTFWLSAPQPDAIRIAAGTQVATVAHGDRRARSCSPPLDDLAGRALQPAQLAMTQAAGERRAIDRRHSSWRARPASLRSRPSRAGRRAARRPVRPGPGQRRRRSTSAARSRASASTRLAAAGLGGLDGRGLDGRARSTATRPGASTATAR